MYIFKAFYIIPTLITNLFLLKGTVVPPVYENRNIPQFSTTATVSQNLTPNLIYPDTNIYTCDTLLKLSLNHTIQQDSLLAFNYQNLKNYIFSNLYYPLEAQEKEIEGEVQIHFSVQKDGKITHIRIEKSVHPLLDSAALNLIQTMPAWKPFTQKPIPDSLSYTIPVIFELKNDR